MWSWVICFDEVDVNWQTHPPIKKTTAIPPSHHVAARLFVKQETIRRIEPIT